MINYRQLSVEDRRVLAASIFGSMSARQIPADWRDILGLPDDGDVDGFDDDGIMAEPLLLEG